MIHKIFEFFKPEYLKILSWLLLNKVMKKSWVEIKKIKGNISKIKDGEFNSDKYIGIELSTLIFLKKSNSLSKFNNNMRLNIIRET